MVDRYFENFHPLVCLSHKDKEKIFCGLKIRLFLTIEKNIGDKKMNNKKVDVLRS